MKIVTNASAKIIFCTVQEIKVTNNSDIFLELKKVAKSYRERYEKTNVSDIPHVQDARTFFRAIGIDPTRRRPSSEALLRRALKGKDFYSVNNLVDAGNWCSLEFLLPICVYDADKIIGTPQVKIGDDRDNYLAINHREMNFNGKFVVCDEVGAFGSPITDSVRTSVTETTVNTLLMIYAPKDYADDKLQELMNIFVHRIEKHCK